MLPRGFRLLVLAATQLVRGDVQPAHDSNGSEALKVCFMFFGSVNDFGWTYACVCASAFTAWADQCIANSGGAGTS